LALDLLLGGLGELNSLLDREVPAITLCVAGGLEGVGAATDLEGELVGRLLLEVGGLVQRKDIGRVCAVGVTLLVEEEQTLASLGGPGSDGVCNIGLLAAEEQVEVLGLDGSIAKPELLLGGDQGPMGDQSTSRFCVRWP
jgi:hypothetical protein